MDAKLFSKYNTKILLIGAFIIVVFSTLLYLGFSNMKHFYQDTIYLINNQQIKRSLLTEMYSASKQRSLILFLMSRKTDAFDLDDLNQQLGAEAHVFLTAHMRFSQLSLDPTEQALFDDLTATTNTNAPLQQQVANLFIDEQREEALDLLISSAIPAQIKVLKIINKTIATYNEISTAYIEQAKNKLNTNSRVFLLLGALLILCCTTAVAIIINRISKKDAAELNRALIDNVQQKEALIKANKVAEIATINAKKSAEEAKTAANEKGQFLANMSHEIRTPMNGVLGLANLLLEEDLQPNHRKMVEIIHQSGDTLLSILDDILSFSKIDSGMIEFEKQPFDLCQLGHGLQQLMQGRANENNISLSCDFKQDALFIKGDKNRIHQILINFLSNAIKFTSKGNVIIVIKLIDNKNGEITFSAGVRDTGIGIKADKLDKIFIEFQQEDSSISRKYGGTGLGLAISKKLVELMDGEMFVESEPNRGSYFYFTMTLPASSPGAIKKVNTGDFHTKNHLHILIVDDNQVNIMVAKGMLLNKFTCDVDFAINGLSACEKTSENNYDIVFMDMQMPIMDGLEATRVIRLRESNKPQHMPIIAMTANALPEHRLACLEAGMDDYLSKPVKADLLSNMVNKWV